MQGKKGLKNQLESLKRNGEEGSGERPEEVEEVEEVPKKLPETK